MCGITGYFGAGNFDREQVVDQMGELMAHRGPDSKGTFIDDYVALGFRRLSIIDLEGGTQPIHTQDGKYVIIFNGEIYNYQDLKKDLIENHGCKFQTESDTEVILQTYTVYGEKTASMLRGMFAFVIYDKINHTLYGARDYFGIKPFYYAQMNGSLLFGSEIKSFLAHPHFHKEVNKEALKMYLIFQYTPLQETMFKGVYKLEPGSYFTYDGKEMKITKYFEPTYEEKERSFDDTVKLISETVRESVKYHKISDVEVGSFLSAGVDSSYIASVARPDKTYTVGFEVDGFDETIYSKELCDKLNMKNTKKEISADEFFDALPSVQYYSDEPHANLSAVPLYFLSELAAKDVKVTLSGEGADEFFGGYDNYRYSKSGDFYRKVVPHGLRLKLGKWADSKKHVRGLNFLIRNAKDFEEGYVGQAFIMDNDEANDILAPAYKSDMTYQDVTRPYFEKVKDMDEFHKKMYLDMHLWLPNDILLKADKMTMAHSLEVRVPFLDKEVWDLARTIPTEYCLSDGLTKKVFRTAALEAIPTDWAKRPKLGFLVPFRVWIKEDKYYKMVEDMFNRDFVSEFFDRDMLLGWLEDNRADKGTHHRKIYTVYSFLLWYEQFFVLR